MSALRGAAICLLLAIGCSREAPLECVPACGPAIGEGSIVVPGNQAWVSTGVHVQEGEAVTVVARGKIAARKVGLFDEEEEYEAEPSGTYLYGDDVIRQPFPLPAAAGGPAPCYCLLGRIGDGPTFYVGGRKSWIADRSGELHLGINDFDVTDNTGQFLAHITKPQSIQPVSFEEAVPQDAAGGLPLPGCSVVVFYVDGLRPDVVREMSAMGHLPNIKRHFLEGGAWMSNSFTAFPSDTITSNGTMWTGCFSDRHGLKGQVRFSRRTLYSESYLEPLGPNRSARLLAPQGIDKIVQETQAASISLARGEEAGDEWRQTRTTGVAPLYEHLRSDGRDWATGVLPMMTEVPPLLWTRSMVRYLPYLRSQEAWQYLDDANAHYATRYLLGRNSPVTIVWLPETDSVSHKKSRGQFGLTRRTIAQADVLIGQVIAELEARGRLSSTYLMLVSDHGHHGGHSSHLSHFDLANELLFKPRQMSPAGEWVGGGLGLSVRQHRFWNRHREDHSRAFVFVDGDSDGAARLFLPRGHFQSGRWMGPPRPGDMLAYRIADHLPPVNLVETLTAAKAAHGNGTVENPVDLVLLRLSDESILIATADRGFAVIDRKRNSSGRWVYKYTPVEEVQSSTSGEVAYRVTERPKTDPLELLEHYPAHLLTYYHDEKTWLRMSVGTRYPDGVVVLTRHMLWQENLKYREAEFVPDLVVTARAGWYFGLNGSPGTMHGYPFQDSMRASWFISGPNIRRGARVDDPCRLVDLTPTILEMAGSGFDPDDLDGTPLRTIYRPQGSRHAPHDAADGSHHPPRGEVHSSHHAPRDEADGRHHAPRDEAPRPVFWQDVDLNGWQKLEYVELPPYEHLPLSINRPDSFFDLNNIAYNVASLGDLSVLRLFDDVLFPVSFPLVKRRQPVTNFVERVDANVRRGSQTWIAEGTQALNIPGVALADYSFTSLGNLKRADGTIDWVQNRGRTLDETLARGVGRTHVPGSNTVHFTIDTVQGTFWEIYRYAQRVVVQVLDETILNGIENQSDQAINAFRRLPAEETVPHPPSPSQE